MQTVWLTVLSGIGNAAQYIFVFASGIVVLVITYDLVMADKLGAEAFTFVAGGIIGGSYGALNPRGRRDEKPDWNGVDRRKREAE